MKIKTNIWHVTANNGEPYEDFVGWAATIQAQTPSQATDVGLETLSKLAGIDRRELNNYDQNLVFENVDLEVPTPEPLKVTIGEITYTYRFDTKKLGIDWGFSLRGLTLEGNEVTALADFMNRVSIEAKRINDMA